MNQTHVLHSLRSPFQLRSLLPSEPDFLAAKKKKALLDPRPRQPSGAKVAENIEHRNPVG